ncbi:reverse transcriptase domain-containing protein [Nitrosomonas sp.]|uniref:reverse transcriptase domain-containing protein n=1 Tax=Nitrosomonas sp. TaxID=42353 RepID=UPI0025CDDD5F|nr:reverse transcriptase domain-containing protein [Nitrosomonas sp.]
MSLGGLSTDALMTMSHQDRIQKNKNIIIVDSGATAHYFNDPKKFSSIHAIPPRQIMVGNGSVLTVRCAGSVPLVLKTQDGKEYPTTIHAMLLPEIPSNFLSTATLDSNGCKLVQERGVICISKKGREIGFAKKANSQWVLQAKWPRNVIQKISLRRPTLNSSSRARLRSADSMHSRSMHASAAYATLNASSRARLRAADNMHSPSMHASAAYATTAYATTAAPSAAASTIKNKRVSPYILHTSLGHQCPSKLRAAVKATQGITLSSPVPNKLNCQACDLTKTKRPAVSKHVPECIRRGNPNRVHADVKTMPHSIRGFRYYVVLLHEGSRRVEARLCKTKDEATNHTKLFIKKLLNDPKTRNGLELRADGGGEFIVHSLQTFLKQNTVDFNPSPPRTPEMNSIAERVIGTLTTMTRVLLKQAHLSEAYWCFAVQVAAYIYNRSHHKKNGIHRTPHETFYGKTPDISNVVPFGCIGVMHIDKVNRVGMLADTGAYVRMLGYDARHGVYLVMTQRGEIKRVKIEKWYKKLFHFPLAWKRAAGPRGGDFPGARDAAMVPRTNEERKENNGPIARTPPASGDDEILAEPRRSNRTTRRPLREGMLPWDALSSLGETTDSLMVTVDEIESIPASFKDAWFGKDLAVWRPSIRSELGSLHDNHTWHAVTIDDKTKTISTKWVFKKKLNPDGTIRYKTRLVCRGYNQEYGVNYFNSYAPTLSLGSLRTLIAIAAKHGYSIHNYDISCAYTYGMIDADIYLDVPEGYIPKDEKEAAFLKTPGRKALKLDRSLYGLVQSGHIWNNTLKDFLIGQGFKPLTSDNCIFKKTVNGRDIIMGVYVDDLIILHKNHDDLAEFTKALAARFKFKNLGPVQKTLGIEVDHNSDGSYSIHQKTYIAQLAEKFGQRCSKRAKTPLVIKKFDDYDKMDKDKCPPVNQTLYRSVIGASLYVAVATRPDILFAVNHLACFCQDPRQVHMEAALRLIRYLINTSHYRITYSKGDLVAYADASWNADAEGSSVSGYFAEFAGGPIAWRSSRQKKRAMSSGEAEYVALSDLGREIVHIRNLFSELKIPLSETTYAHCDSAVAISIATKQGFTQRSKGIRLCYHNVREMVNSKELHLEKIAGTENPADCLTKPLSRQKVEQYAAVFFKARKSQKRVRFQISPPSAKRTKSG